jgi:hypothetical protein
VGARTTNTENASFDHKTNNGDTDLQSINSKIFSQPLKDVAVLSFDVIPTVTGNVYFRQGSGALQTALQQQQDAEHALKLPLTRNAANAGHKLDCQCCCRCCCCCAAVVCSYVYGSEEYPEFAREFVAATYSIPKAPLGCRLHAPQPAAES